MKICLNLACLFFALSFNGLDPQPRTVILLVSNPPRYPIPPSAATFWEEEHDTIVVRGLKSDLVIDELISQMKDTSLYEPSTLSPLDSVDYFSHEIAIIRQRPGKLTDTIYATNDWGLFKKGKVHLVDIDRELKSYLHYLFFAR